MRTRNEPVQCEPSFKQVRFADEKQELEQLEYCHNIVTQVAPNWENNFVYMEFEAMLLAKFMTEIHTKVSVVGASFAQ